MEREIGGWMGAAHAVMWSVYHLAVKKEPCRKAKLSIYWSVEMADTIGQYEHPPQGGCALP